MARALFFALLLLIPFPASAFYVDSQQAARAQVANLTQQQLDSLNTRVFSDAFLAAKVTGNIAGAIDLEPYFCDIYAEDIAEETTLYTFLIPLLQAIYDRLKERTYKPTLIDMDVINSPQALALIPLVVGLVEVVKNVGIPERFAPLASLVIGVALAFFVFPTLPMVILGGIAIGLMASGLYSGVRTMATSA